MPLTDLQIRALKPTEKTYKVADGQGLCIEVTPAGGKHWRFRYRIGGKQKKLALGPYPEITLADARDRTFEARRDVLNGGDPALERKKYQKLAKARDGATFASVAQEYIDKMMVGNGRAESTIQKANYFLSRLESAIGNTPLSEIQAADMLKALKRIEAKGQYETTKKCRSFASRVFRYGVATMRCENDPTSVLKGALISPRPKHHAAILDPYKLGSFMRTVGTYGGALSTQYTLLVLPHGFTRPGELRLAKWPEIDLENAVWRIPAERMKLRRPHIVPLSSQVMSYLTEMAHIWGTEGYLLPSEQTWKKPLSENTVNQAFRRLGFSKDEVTAHGLRATASTLLNESGMWNPDAIERALAHGDTNSIRGVYHRGEHWQERVAMAQWWSDYLDNLRDMPESPARHQPERSEVKPGAIAVRRKMPRGRKRSAFLPQTAPPQLALPRD